MVGGLLRVGETLLNCMVWFRWRRHISKAGSRVFRGTKALKSDGCTGRAAVSPLWLTGAKLYRNIILGSEEDTDKIRLFYKEYFSVMDLTAEFYMQTIQLVFKDYSLPEGIMMYRGEYIDPEAIERTALFAIEGEQDDIAGIGQTKAAMELYGNLPASAKAYRLQKGVGHYGIFNGSCYKKEIVPAMLDFMKKHT